MMRKTGRNFKRMLTGMLSAAMVVSGISLIPMEADAAYGYEDEIQYSSEYDITKYWNADASSRTAPEKEGYVFGGWYADAAGETPLTEDTAGTATSAYAKFVPAYVLSVKAQIDSETTAAGDNKAASIRIVSAVDNKNYQKVGFDILLHNKTTVSQTDGEPLETGKIYTGLAAGGNTYTPAQIFGSNAAFLSVWRLDGIADVNDSKIINVTPYWITMDGTKVEGISKYVHVEDGYQHNVSVPVYVSGKAAFAGTLLMKYPSDVLTVKDVEFCNQAGAKLDQAELKYADDGAGTIRFAAYAVDKDQVLATDGIYANVRFTVKAEASYQGVGSGEFLDFTFDKESFCDWNENLVSVAAWNIQY